MSQKVVVVETNPRLTTGSAGLKTRVYGGCVTVSTVASATGGIGTGNLVKTDN